MISKPFSYFSFFVVVYLMYDLYIQEPTNKSRAISHLNHESRTFSVDDKKILDYMREEPVPLVSPSGTFKFDGKWIRTEYKATFYFNNGSLTKEVVFSGRDKISGSATYSFDGSVLVYTNVMGAQWLFPEIGEAVSVPNSNMVIFHDDDNPLILSKLN